MGKCCVCVLFGGVSSEHEVSLRSARTVLENLDRQKYTVLPVGITREGQWLLYGSDDYSRLPDGSWHVCPKNRRAVLSPEWGGGLLCASGERKAVDVVFPVLHGKNGEDGSVQGLAQLAGIPCVGPGVAASAVAMDKSLTKLVAAHAQVAQADWQVVTEGALENGLLPEELEGRFSYPLFVKPAASGSSVGVSRVSRREELEGALRRALNHGPKALVEEYIPGQEIEVAVLGNEEPVASLCGEIRSGAPFYDYAAKYLTDTSETVIPARISPKTAQQAREAAIRIYKALGCRGLSRVDFFVTDQDRVVFNEINTLPGFASISMYPKLFAASGMPCSRLLDRLIELALEDTYEKRSIIDHSRLSELPGPGAGGH